MSSASKNSPEYGKNEELGILHWPAHPGSEFTVSINHHYLRGTKLPTQCGAVVLNCFPTDPMSYMNEVDRSAYLNTIEKVIIGAEWKAREFGYALMCASLLDWQSRAAEILVQRGWTEGPEFHNVRNGRRIRWFHKAVPDPIRGLPEF